MCCLRLWLARSAAAQADRQSLPCRAVCPSPAPERSATRCCVRLRPPASADRCRPRGFRLPERRPTLSSERAAHWSCGSAPAPPRSRSLLCSVSHSASSVSVFPSCCLTTCRSKQVHLLGDHCSPFKFDLGVAVNGEVVVVHH